MGFNGGEKRVGLLSPGKPMPDDAEGAAAALLDAAVLDDGRPPQAPELLPLAAPLLEAVQGLDEVLHDAAGEGLGRVLAPVHLPGDQDGHALLAGEPGEVVQLAV